MKKFIINLFLYISMVLVLFGCSQIITHEDLDSCIALNVHELSKNMTTKDQITVAAFGFKNNSHFIAEGSGTYIDDLFNHHLSQSDQFKVIEIGKENITRLMQVIADARKDIYNQETMIELGQFTHIDCIVTGSIEDVDNGAFISSRLISLTHAEVLQSSKHFAPYRKSKTSKVIFNIFVIIFIIILICCVLLCIPSSIRPVQEPDQSGLTTCSLCGRKIKDVFDKGGVCKNPKCENILCTQCWNEDRKRYCQYCSESM